MIGTIIIVLTVFTVAYLAYTCYIRPKRLHSYYVKTLKGMGYKVL